MAEREEGQESPFNRTFGPWGCYGVTLLAQEYLKHLGQGLPGPCHYVVGLQGADGVAHDGEGVVLNAAGLGHGPGGGDEGFAADTGGGLSCLLDG